MALSKSQRKANDKYIAANYKQIAIRYPNEFVDAVKAAAAASGLSLAGYIRKAIEKQMQEDGAHE